MYDECLGAWGQGGFIGVLVLGVLLLVIFSTVLLLLPLINNLFILEIIKLVLKLI
jgi:hypothetical protein